MSLLPLFTKPLSEPRPGRGREAEAPLPRSQGPAASCPCPHRPSEPLFLGCSGGSAPSAALPWLLTAAELPYKPALTKTPPLEGLTTASTFVLDQPRCVFGEYGNADIWLVVALDKGR